MNITSRMAQRVTAAAVATAAAIAIPAVALAAPGHPAAPAAPAAAPGCAAAQLVAWVGIPGDAAAGSVRYQLELSNVSHSTCTLFGFPGVSADGPHGGQLGSAAVRDHSHSSALLTLRRGATAHMELTITDVANFSASSCHPRRADSLRVYPPNDRRSLVVPLSFRACGRHGPKYLSVSTAIGGTGVPLFSS
jgi:hypothetical protein